MVKSMQLIVLCSKLDQGKIHNYSVENLTFSSRDSNDKLLTVGYAFESKISGD
jgi:hypothetical protein